MGIWHRSVETIFHKHLKFERTKRVLIFFLFIIICLIIAKSIFPCIDIIWWLNLIGLILNFLAALIIGEGTTINCLPEYINGNGVNVYPPPEYLLKIGTNLLLVGFSLQLISLIIPV